MKDRTLLIACLAVGVALAVSLPAQALSLGYQGPITIEVATGATSGTNYGALAAGSYGGPAYTAGNVALMDAIGAAHTNNDASLVSGASEDTFGIFQVKRIHGGSNTGAPVIYTAGVDGPEMSGVFYGSEDFAAEVNADGDQTIFAAGMMLDVYENPVGTLAAAGGFGQGTAEHIAAPGGEAYSGVSLGAPLWSLVSERGFVSSSRPDATFETTAQISGGIAVSANGELYASVGATAAPGGLGTQNSMIDFDPWVVASSSDPGTVGNTADVWITFDADSQGTPGDWDLNINDDAKMQYAPEPSGILLAFLAVPLASLVQALRRHGKKL